MQYRQRLLHLSTMVLLGSALATIAFVLLAIPAALRDRAQLAHEIAVGFDSGALITDNFFALDTRRGRTLVNDCLLLQTLTVGRGGVMDRVVSSYTLQRAPAAPCLHLREFVLGSDAAGALYPYSRYFWGAKAIVGPVLALAPVDDLKQLLCALIYLTLIGAGLFSVTRFTSGSSASRRRHRTILVVAAGLVLLYELRFSALTFANGFSELVLAGYLLYAAVRPATTGQTGKDVGLIALGVLTAWFELLTGATVMAIGIAALVESADGEPGQSVRNAARAAAVVASSIALPLVFLQFLVAVFGDPQNVKQFAYHLMLRMQLHQLLPVPIEGPWRIEENLHSYSLGEVFLPIIYNLQALTYGSKVAAAIVFPASVLVLAVACIRSRGKSRQAVVTCCLVVSLLPLWYMAFSNHTAVHAYFMVRLMVLLPICAVLALMNLVVPARRL